MNSEKILRVLGNHMPDNILQYPCQEIKIKHKINKTSVSDIFIDSTKAFDTTSDELLLVKVKVKTL